MIANQVISCHRFLACHWLSEAAPAINHIVPCFARSARIGRALKTDKQACSYLHVLARSSSAFDFGSAVAAAATAACCGDASPS